MRTKIIDLEGRDPESLGIEISLEGVFREGRGTEGAEYRTREYSYIDTLAPFRLLINGQEISLPPSLRDAIEENIKETFFE